MLQILIRHGESLSNREGRVQGQADVKLSDTGRQQATAVASWCKSQSFHKKSCELWSSPLCRARETADVIGTAIGLSAQIEDKLVELNAGVFQGHLWDDLADRFPEDVAQWRSGDVDFQIPGGESRRQLAERGRHALQSLSCRPVDSMVIVAHGGVLTAALGLLVGREHPLLANVVERPFTRLPALGNCSVSQLKWPGPELLSFNQMDHLG
ncbi:MAG: histidine phosphatase family protein [Pirellulales bacterium]|nr:histidine phosphatase family protein [Pirellulales bacterium]MEC7710206.1 histidine phosphatase family protein [Planctomycetota bacterium]MEE2796024.1 histidine phosphatase family protein [Planctomycetota bacterium]